MDTNRNILEIENIIAKSKQFNFLNNFIAFNVIGNCMLKVEHECDCLVCNKSGYLTEIEIKRSYNDFLNDFKKTHDHYSNLIKYFYYCVPESIEEKVLLYLKENYKYNDFRFDAGVISYSDKSTFLKTLKSPRSNNKASKLFLEQRMEMLRLECIKNVKLKDKIIQLQKNEISIDCEDSMERFKQAMEE